jgi:hypothetical protein
MKKQNNSGYYSGLFRCLIVLIWILVVLWNLNFLLSKSNQLRSVSNQQLNIETQKENENKPKMEKQKITEITEITKDEKDDKIHIVFSTDCSFFQDWQTIIVFHSARMVGQKGQITRIASGCKEAKQLELRQLYKVLFPNFHIHFTPDFKTDGSTKKKYDFYNKPYGMEHWLDYADPPIESGTIIALIDPDFIFLRKISIEFSKDDNLIFTKVKDNTVEVPKVYSKGHPVAQLYGLGAPWTSEHSRVFSKTDVCGKDSPCFQVSNKFGNDHYR